MAKKKSRKKKTSTAWWQWVLIAAAAFGLYHGLDHFLSESPIRSAKKPAKKVASVKEKKAQATAAPTPAKPSPTPAASPAASPTPTPTSGPVAKWDFKETSRLLPKDSFPDNYRPISVKGNEIGLIAHAKLIPGKKPGPKGLTNTKPALTWYRLEGEKYASQDLNFADLKGALGASAQQLSGLPELGKSPLHQGDTTLYLTRLFLGENPMEATAIVAVNDQGIRWANLQESGGKSAPAAFLKGTTRLSTREVRTEQRSGKLYLIAEQGSLDEAKLYEGYRWKISAYYWDGKQFVLDREYSDKLTKGKKAGN